MSLQSFVERRAYRRTPVAGAPTGGDEPAPDPAFSLRGVSLGYGGDPVIDSLDLDIPAGRTTALVGANGCGKSTLLRGLTRQLAPTAGTILCDGVPLTDRRGKRFARHVALLPQAPLVPEGLTVAELVSRGRHPHKTWFGGAAETDDRVVAEALEATGTTPFAERVVDELSGGQRQRVWLALVLAQDTPILLLDEPCSFLDVAHQLDILDLVADLRLPGTGAEEGRRRTVVAVLHELGHAVRIADHVVALAGGTVVAQGPPREVLTPEVLHEVFELDAEVIDDPTTGDPVVLPRRRSERRAS